MTATQSIHIESDERGVEPRARRTRNRRRSAAQRAVAGGHAGAPESRSPDRADATRGPGGGQILRRWSVTDLIARAGGAPRAFA